MVPLTLLLANFGYMCDDVTPLNEDDQLAHISFNSIGGDQVRAITIYQDGTYTDDYILQEISRRTEVPMAISTTFIRYMGLKLRTH